MGFVSKILDLATDPSLDLAHEVHSQQRHARDLTSDLESSKSKVAKLEEKVASKAVKLDRCEDHAKTLRKEVHMLEKKIENLIANNFAAAVETYSSPGMLKKHKPNAETD